MPNTHDVMRLQAQIRDLAALLALPATLRGREVPFIVSSLLDALVSLLRVDFAYLRLEALQPNQVVEDWLPRRESGDSPVRVLLEHCRTDDRNIFSAVQIADRAPMLGLRLFPRIPNARVVVVLFSERPDFPTDIESFLLRSAIDQGMMAIEASRLLHELQEANLAKAAFLATMSHELRTPLNAILGYVDLLDAEVAGSLNHGQKQSLLRVRAGSLHLMQLVEGILSFARIDAGKEEVYAEKIDICTLARETAELVEPLASVQDLAFVIRTPDRPIPFVTDPSKVRQILLNLLSNAMKFTKSGRVELDLAARDGGIVITVRDTGPGIAVQDHEKIFEPFRQVGDVYTQKSKGTGLGLSVSRQLARLLGGDVTVKSAPGAGSEFTLSLPA